MTFFQIIYIKKRPKSGTFRGFILNFVEVGNVDNKYILGLRTLLLIKSTSERLVHESFKEG